MKIWIIMLVGLSALAGETLNKIKEEFFIANPITPSEKLVLADETEPIVANSNYQRLGLDTPTEQVKKQIEIYRKSDNNDEEIGEWTRRWSRASNSNSGVRMIARAIADGEISLLPFFAYGENSLDETQLRRHLTAVSRNRLVEKARSLLGPCVKLGAQDYEEQITRVAQNILDDFARLENLRAYGLKGWLVAVPSEIEELAKKREVKLEMAKQAL